VISFSPSTGSSNDPAASVEREWLVTNGLGGYASGTVAGVLTRRYHGLLVAALDPPLGRTVLVAKADESISFGEGSVPLYANQWWNGDSPFEPPGFTRLVTFRLDGTIPVWSYRVDGAVVEKRIWMEPVADVTYLDYTYVSGDRPLDLDVRITTGHRDFHSTTRANDRPPIVDAVAGGVRIRTADGTVPVHLLSGTATIEPRNEWHRGYFLRMEAFRGLDALEDDFLAGHASAVLAPGESMTLVFSVRPGPNLDGRIALAVRRRYDDALIGAADTGGDELVDRLVLAADQFIVERTVDGDDGSTVIAGYHWFGDWGRDTMIALPGLTLATGRHAEAAQILRTFARHVDRGMLPNRFPDDGDRPEYNTIDATLWFFEAIRGYHAATGDGDLVADLFPILVDIVDHHERGTRHGIGVDPADGLLRGGEPGVQLTWMDYRVGDRVVTPRSGKPVEINALWYNALRIMGDFARMLDGEPSPYDAAADRVRTNFERFWNDERGYLFDVIDGPDGDDPSLRPNQLFAVSLHHSPLSPSQQRAIVDVCAGHLLTPMGLRTLGPDEPGYRGRYGGGVVERDGAYHQGTVWPWLIGPFADHLAEYGMGSIAECAEGDAPHAPRAAIAQAWSVAEVLRIVRRYRSGTSSTEQHHG